MPFQDQFMMKFTTTTGLCIDFNPYKSCGKQLKKLLKMPKVSTGAINKRINSKAKTCRELIKKRISLVDRF